MEYQAKSKDCRKQKFYGCPPADWKSTCRLKAHKAAIHANEPRYNLYLYRSTPHQKWNDSCKSILRALS